MSRREMVSVAALLAVATVASGWSSAGGGVSSGSGYVIAAASPADRDLAAGLIAGSDLSVDIDSLSLGPVTGGPDMPAGLFGVPDAADLRNLIPARDWNDRRRRAGLAPLDIAVLSLGQLQELVGSTAESGFGYFRSEEPQVRSWLDHMAALRDFHAKMLGLDGFLTSRIDEAHGTYQAWVKGPVTTPAPAGAQVFESAFSRTDVAAEIRSSGLATRAEQRGLSINAVIETPTGATIEISKPGVTDAQQIQTTVSELDAFLAANSPADAGAGAPVFVLKAVPDPQITEAFCDNRTRCSHLQGGLDGPDIGGCTTGFALTLGSQRAISTAGHCTFPVNQARLAIRGWDGTNAGNTRYVAGFTQPLPPVSQGQTNPSWQMDGDIQALTPPHQGTVINTYFRDSLSGNNPITTISGRPPVGTVVCASARNLTSERCGIVDVPFVQLSDAFGWIRVDFDDSCCDHIGLWKGDSGGVVTLESDFTAAVAVVAAVDGITPLYSGGFRYGYFPIAEDIPNQYGGWTVMTGNIWPTYQDSFISGLYQSALQREPEIWEVDYWANGLPSSGYNCMAPAKWRIEMFLKSAEIKTNPDLTLNTIANAQQRIRRLYWSAFNRPPDPGGLDYWDNVLLNGGEPTWDWMVSYFLYNVTSESNPRITSVVNQERGPCIN